MIYLDFGTEAEEFVAAATRGLRSRPRRISPKYFYNDRGSMLFEEICRQPEYYPTRVETLILHQHIAEIEALIEEDSASDLPPVLIEFGSGASVKTEILLNRLKLETYIPLDISKDFLLKTADELRKKYPSLRIIPAFGDFTREFHFPEFVLKDSHARLAFLPGSTLGNFDPLESVRILRSIHAALSESEHGYLLIGIDLAKDPQLLEAAYNDAAGVTAAFNKNLIERLREETGADIRSQQFDHRAYFNEKLSRVEMHLVAQSDMGFQIAGESFRIERGESIHTENSYKYRPQTFQTLCRDSGFETLRFWTDPQEWFGVFLLKAQRKPKHVLARAA